jgi:hypothetical protein
MIKAYLNSENDINMCIINNPDKFEMYTVRKSSDLFPENYSCFGPTVFLYKNVATWLQNQVLDRLYLFYMIQYIITTTLKFTQSEARSPGTLII